MQPYRRILVALDGSPCSDLAAEAASQFALKGSGISLTGCHVYAARLHRSRFLEMEPGLPGQYREEERLGALRTTHEDLITHGLKTIADNYAAPLNSKLGGNGVSFSFLTPEGKNYVRILDLIAKEQADLVVIGLHGQGRVPESDIGSTAERTATYAVNSDVLLMRAPWDVTSQPIIVGIDGSPDSIAALSRALEISRIFGGQVLLVSVFDPYFHSTVFRTISGNLSEESKNTFNFSAQEKIHDQIINDGLGQLYREKLDMASEYAGSRGFSVTTSLETGKTFPQLARFASLHNAGLIVVGRFGNHRDPLSMIGSVPASLARTAETNILIVAPESEIHTIPNPSAKEPSVRWTPGAEELMNNVPEFARGMARKAIEGKVTKLGGTVVTPEAVRELASDLGMPDPKTARGREQVACADVVVLKKIRRFAPDFHRHIVGSKLVGRVIRLGDRVMMYEVLETTPDGPVLVSERTRIEFA